MLASFFYLRLRLKPYHVQGLKIVAKVYTHVIAFMGDVHCIVVQLCIRLIYKYEILYPFQEELRFNDSRAPYISSVQIFDYS